MDTVILYVVFVHYCFLCGINTLFASLEDVSPRTYTSCLQHGTFSIKAFTSCSCLNQNPFVSHQNVLNMTELTSHQLHAEQSC